MTNTKYTYSFFCHTPVHLRIGEGKPGELVLLVTTRDGAPWTEYDVKFRARVANATSKQLFRRAVTPANVIRMKLFYWLPANLYSVRVRPVKDGNLKGKWSNKLRGVRTPQGEFYYSPAGFVRLLEAPFTRAVSYAILRCNFGYKTSPGPPRTGLSSCKTAPKPRQVRINWIQEHPRLICYNFLPNPADTSRKKHPCG